jgi:hypothetical protein
MGTFIAVDDQVLAERIGAAASRVVFVAPAVSKTVAAAFGECFRKADRVSITLVLDPDEDPYRLGFGDREGLEHLQHLARDHHIGIRSHPGLRIGLLLTDDAILVWSPTAKAVESQRVGGQPNGIDLPDTNDFSRMPSSSDTASPLAHIIRNAVAFSD